MSSYEVYSFIAIKDSSLFLVTLSDISGDTALVLLLLLFIVALFSIIFLQPICVFEPKAHLLWLACS